MLANNMIIAVLQLLVDLTSISQTDLQKLIAFEDAFPRIFRLIETEGGVAEGAVTVQDCLSLLANLIRHSPSNQTLFRETGHVQKLLDLVKQASMWDQDENAYARLNREKNSWGLLAVISLFVEQGESGTKTNQDIFYKTGLCQVTLDLGFNFKAPLPIRSSSLKACADMITMNSALQESFAALLVDIEQEHEPETNGVNGTNGVKVIRTYVIEALLNRVLHASTLEYLDLRAAAATCIKAYCLGHQRIRHHFLQRAIAGHLEGEDVGSNILSTLAAGYQASETSDILQFILATDIMSQLLADDEEAKQLLQAVSEGNAEKGEDVISAVQLLAGHLTATLQNDTDARISVAYLMLLITAFYDSQLMINDCLAEGSSLLTALVDMAGKCHDSQILADPIRSLLPGLCAILMGIIYEFSSRDSPISRRTLQPFLNNKLGRQRYLDALMSLRQHPLVRDFELTAQTNIVLDSSQILFNSTFIELIKEEYGRLRRAIDKDPGIEVIHKGEGGVDRDILDELRAQITSKDEAMQILENQTADSKQVAEQASLETRKEIQSLQANQKSLEAEVDRIRKVNERLQKDNEIEVQRLKDDMNHEIERIQQSSNTSHEQTRQQHEKEIERLRKEHAAILSKETISWDQKLRDVNVKSSNDLKKKVDEMSLSAKNMEASVRDDHQKQLTTIKNDHTKIVLSLNNDIQKRDNDLVVTRQDLKTAKSDFLRATDDLEKSQKLNSTLSSDLQKTKDQQTDLQSINNKATTRVKTLEEENKRHQARHDILSTERDNLTSQRLSSDTEVISLKDEIDSLKLELVTERKGYSLLEAELEQIKNEPPAAPTSELNSADMSRTKATNEEVEGLKAEMEKKVKEVEAQKLEMGKIKGELDDMLMVMSDIEAKRDEYRDRLKRAGEHVSEDEDEDENENEDEDEANQEVKPEKQAS